MLFIILQTFPSHWLHHSDIYFDVIWNPEHRKCLFPIFPKYNNYGTWEPLTLTIGTQYALFWGLVFGDILLTFHHL